MEHVAKADAKRSPHHHKNDPEPPAEAGSAPKVETPEKEGVLTVETLTAERDRLAAEKDELWDRFVRKQAELENVRKRTQREKEEVLQFAAMELVRSLIPVLDDFERALKVPVAQEEYHKGMELIYKRLYDTLVKAGLTPIESLGKKFDPHSHQAVDTVQSEEHEDHTVVEEFQRGYEFKGRLVRPAMVKVAVRG